MITLGSDSGSGPRTGHSIGRIITKGVVDYQQPPCSDPGLNRLKTREPNCRLSLDAALREKGGSHLYDELPEHGITTRSLHGVYGRLPHFPSVDQRSSEQQPNQFEVASADMFERRQLFEVIQFAVQDIGLHPHSMR